MSHVRFECQGKEWESKIHWRLKVGDQFNINTDTAGHLGLFWLGGWHQVNGHYVVSLLHIGPANGGTTLEAKEIAPEAPYP